MRKAVRHQAAIKYASPWVTVTIQQSQAGSTALNDQSHPRVEEAQSQDDEEAEVRIVHAAAYDSTEPNKPAPPAEPSPDEDQPQHQQSRTPTDTELEIRKRWLEKIREEWWDVDAEKHLRRVIRRHPNYPNQMKLENWYPENVLSEHDVEKINAALQHLRDIVQSKNQSPEESRPSLEYLSDLLEEVLANQARRE